MSDAYEALAEIVSEARNLLPHTTGGPRTHTFLEWVVAHGSRALVGSDDVAMARALDAADTKIQRLAAINEQALSAGLGLIEALRTVRQDYKHHDCMSDGCTACLIDAALARTTP